jgi:hypothetical protein
VNTLCADHFAHLSSLEGLKQLSSECELRTVFAAVAQLTMLAVVRMCDSAYEGCAVMDDVSATTMSSCVGQLPQLRVQQVRHQEHPVIEEASSEVPRALIMMQWQ